MRVKPQIGDVVKSTVPTETIAGYVVGVEGIWLWVRYFDTAAQRRVLGCLYSKN